MILNVTRKFIVCISIVTLTACIGGNSESDQTKTTKLRPSFAKETHLNDSLVSNLGVLIEDAVYDGESKDFIQNFDLERFNHRATYTEYTSSKIKRYQKGFIDGFSKGIEKFPEEIIAVVKGGGFYDFLTFYHDKETNNYRMLFRLFSETEGLNYHDYKLARKNGEFFIEDIYIYLTGENLSETANRIYLLSLPKNLFQKIIQGDNSKDIGHLVKAVKSQEIQNYTSTIEHLSKIEGALKHDRFFHVLNILAAENLDDAHYMTAMENMQKDFANDPTCNLLSMDYYFMKSDFEKTIQVIDALEEQTGDSFLNFQRGNYAYALEYYEKAAEYYTKLSVDYPDYYTAKFSTVNCYALLGNYQKCITLLDEILKEDVYTAAEIIDYVESENEDGTNELTSLMQSKQYLNWKTNAQ